LVINTFQLEQNIKHKKSLLREGMVLDVGQSKQAIMVPEVGQKRKDKFFKPPKKKSKRNNIHALQQTAKPIISETQSPVYCLCQKSYVEGELMVECGRCGEWYHPRCVGMDEAAVRGLDDFTCALCACKIVKKESKGDEAYIPDVGDEEEGESQEEDYYSDEFEEIDTLDGEPEYEEEESDPYVVPSKPITHIPEENLMPGMLTL